MKKLYINPVTREIAPKHRSQKSVYIAKKDHNSVMLWFEIPKIVDGCDMSASENIIHIHYANIDAVDETKVSKGMSEATNVTVDEADEVVSFAWRIPNTATRYAGAMSIGITFERYEEVDGTTEEVYSWSTSPCGIIVVQDSMDNSADVCDKDYDYLVETCNAIVSKALDDKVTTAIGTINDEVTTAIKTMDNKLSEADAKISESLRETKIFNDEAHQNALATESWAHGDTGTRENEETDNALYYYEQARIYAQNANDSAMVVEEVAGSVTESAEQVALDKKDIDVIRNITWQYREEAEQFSRQAKENAEAINPIYCNALKGKAIGIGAVRLDDVSPLTHNMTVSTDVQTGFKSYGKNLFLTANPRRATNTVTVTDNVIKWYGDYYFIVPVHIPKGVPFTWSYGKYENDGTSTFLRVTKRYTDGTGDSGTSQDRTQIPEKDMNELWVYKSVAAEINTSIITDFQIEIGSTATEYEMGKQPVDGVEAIIPTTTLIADISEANLTAEYNKDINGVIAKLEQAIANL